MCLAATSASCRAAAPSCPSQRRGMPAGRTGVPGCRRTAAPHQHPCAGRCSRGGAAGATPTNTVRATRRCRMSIPASGRGGGGGHGSASPRRAKPGECRRTFCPQTRHAGPSLHGWRPGKGDKSHARSGRWWTSPSNALAQWQARRHPMIPPGSPPGPDAPRGTARRTGGTGHNAAPERNNSAGRVQSAANPGCMENNGPPSTRDRGNKVAQTGRSTWGMCLRRVINTCTRGVVFRRCGRREPDDGKRSRPVLRGEGRGDVCPLTRRRGMVKHARCESERCALSLLY